MKKLQNNYAFIDSQNLNMNILNQGWKLDFRKFRIYLKEKCSVKKAYLFIGYIKGNNKLYLSLQNAGFLCIFKPTLSYKDGVTKGNCDAELVLQTMIELNNFDKAVIITGDGDFYCLVEHLKNMNKLERVLVPNRYKYSALLKKFAQKDVEFMNDLKNKLEYKKRTP